MTGQFMDIKPYNYTHSSIHMTTLTGSQQAHSEHCILVFEINYPLVAMTVYYTHW